MCPEGPHRGQPALVGNHPHAVIQPLASHLGDEGCLQAEPRPVGPLRRGVEVEQLGIDERGEVRHLGIDIALEGGADELPHDRPVRLQAASVDLAPRVEVVALELEAGVLDRHSPAGAHVEVVDDQQALGLVPEGRGGEALRDDALGRHGGDGHRFLRTPPAAGALDETCRLDLPRLPVDEDIGAAI